MAQKPAHRFNLGIRGGRAPGAPSAMKTRRQYDLVIIGADAAGMAAAACAARQGADIGVRVALIRTGEEQTGGVSAPGVPDFVWRRLNLQETAYAAKPVEAMVSLFDDGRMLSTYQNRRKTAAAVADAEVDPNGVYHDLSGSLERLWESAENVLHLGARTGRGVIERLAADDGACFAERFVGSLDAVLDDHFEDGALKTHLASAALMPFGLAGDEPGSALALAAMSDAAAWRMRPADKSPSLVRILEEAAKSAGVEFFESGVVSVQHTEGRGRKVVLENGDTLRTARVMAASAASPTASRLGSAWSLSPLARKEGASAEVRVKLGKAPPPPAGHKSAIYFAPGSSETLKAARDAALEGRLPDEPPIFFEFHKDEIVVRAPYCPAALYSDDEPRDWSEQDRQMLGRLVLERLGKVLNGAVQNVRKVDVKITVRGVDIKARPNEAGVLVPPTSHDEIGAASRLAMELVLGE